MNEKNTGISEKLFLLLMCFAIFYITMRFLLPLALPFVLAYLISRLVIPVSRKIRARSKSLDKPATVVLLLLLFALMFFVVRLLVTAAFGQLSTLTEALMSDVSSSGGFINRLTEFFRGVASHVPFLKGEAQNVDKTADLIVTFARETLSYVSSLAADAAGSVLASLPSFFIGLFVTLTASFYFSLDRGSFGDFVNSYIPEGSRQKVRRYRSVAAEAAAGYVKTYLLMMLVVFTLLYLGFTVIGVEYAFILALITALVDLLPVLGVGTVLVPWAAASLLLGDVRLAVSLMILFAAVTVVRELLEPKIIGGYIGVHPILALVAVYFGMRLFGVCGLVASPIILSVILSLIKAGREDEKSPAPAEPERDGISSTITPSGLSDRSLRRPGGTRRTSDPSARR